MLRTSVLLVLLGFGLSITRPELTAQDFFGDGFSEQDAIPTPAIRPLADGVLKIIPPEIEVGEGLVYPRPYPGLSPNEYSPNLFPISETLSGRTSGIVRYRDVWQLEFAFKELRYLEVKLPLPDGHSQAAGIWYLIYRVRNVDKHLSFPVDETTGEVQANRETALANIDPNALPGRFFPSFLLEGWVEDSNGDYVLRAYRDSVLPAALSQIAEQEKLPGLRDNVSIARENLADTEQFPDNEQFPEGVWGVATWLDVDPRINFASVSVQGLSNAFRTDQDGGDAKHQVKTLQINFWRPGDSNLGGARFQLGVAFDDDDLVRQKTLLEKYRLPGPELIVERMMPETGAPVTLGHVPAQYNLETMESELIQQLEGQQVPESLVDFLAKHGFPGADNFTVTAVPNSQRWKLEGPDGQSYLVSVQPISWQVNDEKIDFVGPLDCFWNFRYIF